RHGTPPAGHYDPDARSSLCPIRCSPKRKLRGAAGEGSAGPEPKIATVRAPGGGRPASWDARRLVRRLACRVTCRPNGCLASTRRLSALRHPFNRGSEAKVSKPGRKKTRRGNEEVLLGANAFSSSFRPSRDSGEGRNP